MLCVFKKVLFIIVLLTLIVACGARVEKGVLKPEEMENLLFDYHLAQALAKGSGDSVNFKTQLYINSVYKKYNINESDFNHSMEWYTRNSEELFKIYKRIDERYALAVSMNKMPHNPYVNMTAVGDTMNIWNGRNFYLLSSNWENRLEFELITDSLVADGDRIMWQFDTHWYYKDGQKSAIALLAAVYENDSIATVMQSLYSTGKQEIYLNIRKKNVKMLYGFIYQLSEWTEQPRLLAISDPVLVRFRKKKESVVMDSLKTDSVKQGRIVNVDSLDEEKEDSWDEKDIQENESKTNDSRILRLPS